MMAAQFISKRRDFKQLEDFNVKRDAHSRKYHEEYMRRMGGQRRAQSSGAAAARRSCRLPPPRYSSGSAALRPSGVTVS